MAHAKVSFMRDDIPSWNQAQGRIGEAFAKKYLRKQGFKIIAERYRTRYGEIDLIARRKDTLLFVEVKARNSLSHGHPLEAVTKHKLEHLRKAAFHFLAGHLEYQRGWYWEIGAISVQRHQGKLEAELVRILP